MQQKIILKYINEGLHLGVVSWREVYLLHPAVSLLNVEVDNGRLVYRAKGSSKRITYQKMKKGLKATTKYIMFEVPNWMI